MPNSFQGAGSFFSCVGGLHDAPATVSYGSSRDAVYVSLRPAGVRAILGAGSAELSRRVVDLRDIWGSAVDPLHQRLSESSTWAECFGVLDHVLLRRVRPVRTPSEIAWAWERILKTGGQTAVHRLAREAGWGRRHFAERFRTEIGVSPKTAARILRFERACQLINRERPGLAQVAAACGFHDQSHMSREWNLLAGCTPRAWMSRELPFFQDFDSWSGDNEQAGLRRETTK